MVQYDESAHTFPFPLPYILLAHNQRYPSPYGLHILSSDVISRQFLPSNPAVLRTTRLILKKGKVPRWAPRMIQAVDRTWVLEETDVEFGLVGPKGEPVQVGDGEKEGKVVGRELRTRSRNIDRTEFMEVFEWQTFRETPGDPLSTDVKTLTRVTSEFGFWPVPARIEAFGLSKLPRSVEGARLGLSLLASLHLRPSVSPTLLSSGPLDPYVFEPVPSQFTLAMRAKLDEARQALGRDGGGGGEFGRAAGGAEGRTEEGEPKGLRLWRERWRAAVMRNKRRFRERVCAVTGLLCDEPSPAGAGAVSAAASPPGAAAQ
ncbi:hypothetical protein JCM6882_007111 [Rhodosporidiobolus microsporus]